MSSLFNREYQWMDQMFGAAASDVYRINALTPANEWMLPQLGSLGFRQLVGGT